MGQRFQVAIQLDELFPNIDARMFAFLSKDCYQVMTDAKKQVFSAEANI